MIRPARRRCALAATLLHALALAAGGALGAGGMDRRGTQWGPCLEWRLENPSVAGNPFDLVATATFVHQASGERRTTEMFHDGGSAWAFRFTATRPGTWTFTTKCEDPDLDGRRGTVTVEANERARGFVTALGNKWGWTGTRRAFVPQLVMFATPDRFHGKPQVVDAAIRTFLVEHGFNGFHCPVHGAWFDIAERRHDRIRSADPTPDRRTFEALEMLITKTCAAGGMVHLWAWGDEARKWTPGRWGKNGAVDRRLQRTIAARLGPLPGWTMGYGFDLHEWVRGDDLKRWHAHLHEHFGWHHLLGGRAHNNRLTQIFEGLDYSGYEQHRPDYAKYCETLDQRSGKPSLSEDRFRIRLSARYKGKDYTMERTRRGLWHSTMAGGVANIWGNLMGVSDSSDGSAPYPKPHWIQTWSRFFRHRFTRDVVRANTLTDGVCLRRPTKAHFVFYREDADGIRMDLSTMAGPQPAVAVDCLMPYAELDLGTLAPKAHAWRAPRESDWAIAVGTWPRD